MKKFALGTFTALTAIGLSACGGQAATDEHSGESTIYSFVLRDAKTIDCVVADGNKSGSMDCGWNALYESTLTTASNSGNLKERLLTSKTGHVVRCIELSGNYISGISCDWTPR